MAMQKFYSPYHGEHTSKRKGKKGDGIGSGGISDYGYPSDTTGTPPKLMDYIKTEKGYAGTSTAGLGDPLNVFGGVGESEASKGGVRDDKMIGGWLYDPLGGVGASEAGKTKVKGGVGASEAGKTRGKGGKGDGIIGGSGGVTAGVDPIDVTGIDTEQWTSGQQWGEGGDLQSFLESAGYGDITDKYKKLLPQYDPTKEKFAQRNLFSGLSNVRQGAGQSLLDLFMGAEQAQAKSGFAGAGAIRGTLGRGRQQVMKGVRGATEQGLMGFEENVHGLREDWQKSIIDRLADFVSKGSGNIYKNWNIGDTYSGNDPNLEGKMWGDDRWLTPEEFEEWMDKRNDDDDY